MSQWTTRLRVAVVAVLAALALFVFVYPTRALLSQGNDIGQTRHDLAALQQQNRTLELEVLKLRTPAEIERIARQRFNMIKPNEHLYAVVPAQPGATNTTTTASTP
ncbi:MAG TPA: septum formation initiator family protein [Acidimicrobiia bacterium]|jgi:cell division protein FtsL